VALRRAHLLVVLFLFFAASSASAGLLEGTVVRVVDGDTIHVQLGDHVEKIRYIGVNSPEIHHPIKGEEPGGREAAEVNRRLVDGHHVRLELDVRARDRYGRLLAYVWVGDTMVNAELLRLGYAQVMTVPPNVRHQDLFLKLQREARDSHRGLWLAGRN
jgi:micrococcal nuclease